MLVTIPGLPGHHAHRLVAMATTLRCKRAIARVLRHRSLTSRQVAELQPSRLAHVECRFVLVRRKTFFLYLV